MNVTTRFATALVLLAVVLALGGTLVLLAAPGALAATVVPVTFPPEAWGIGLAAASASTAFATLGAGYAVAKVGTAAIGALAEKPDLFGRLLIFVGLAEGIAIYGLIMSILILNKLT